MLTVYLDESGHETGEHVVVAGFMGTDQQWAEFLPHWKEAVGIQNDSFHIKSLRWNRDSTRKRLEKLGKIPYLHGLRAVIGAVRASDYTDLAANVAEKYAIQGYLIALFPILSALFLAVPDGETVKWVLEEQHDYESQARRVFRSFAQTHGASRFSDVSFISKNKTRLTEPADFLAYAVLQELRDPYSTRADWSRPIRGDGSFLGMIVGRETIRNITNQSLSGAASLTTLQTGKDPRMAFQGYSNKKSVEEGLRRAEERRKANRS